MPLFRRALALAALAVPATLLAAPPAVLADDGSAGAVYVVSNQTSGNRVIAYDRAADGTLTPTGSFATGGTGTAAGLGSQGAVIIEGRYLYAVNAGSNTVTSFRIEQGGLARIGSVPSGGTRPTSVTVHGGVAYVLNAGGTGNISGFTVRHGQLAPLPGSSRPVSGPATAPAQVSFTPDGSQLIVSERASNTFAVYAVGSNGLATGPTTLASAGSTPFGFEFGHRDTLVVSEAFGGAANASAVSSYAVGAGALAVESASVPTTETAACWIAVTGNGRYAYAGNAGTNSVTGYRVAPDGSLAVLDADGKTGTAAAGVTDLALSRNSQFLYGRLGDNTVGAWSVDSDGGLTSLGAFPGLPAGAAGIAAA